MCVNKWCSVYNGMVNCTIDCANCELYHNNKISHQYNYKCPDCKGEFNQPFYKYILENNRHFACKSAHWAFVCPFCNKEMKGLS